MSHYPTEELHPDDYIYKDNRTFREVSAIRRWLTWCEKKTAFYLGRKVQFWSDVHICTKVYFTEPGLVPYFHLDGYSGNPVPETAWLRWFPRIGDTVQIVSSPTDDLGGQVSKEWIESLVGQEGKIVDSGINPLGNAMYEVDIPGEASNWDFAGNELSVIHYL